MDDGSIALMLTTADCECSMTVDDAFLDWAVIMIDYGQSELNNAPALDTNVPEIKKQQ